MNKLVRFGVSFDEDLFVQFCKMNKEKNCSNRSEVIRELVRRELRNRDGSHQDEIVGIITFLSKNHQGEPLDKIMDTHYIDRKMMRSLQHITLDQSRYLDIAIVQGDIETIKRLADAIGTVKEVEYCKLAISTVDEG